MREFDLKFEEVSKAEMDHLAKAFFEGAIYSSHMRNLRILPLTITIDRINTKERWGMKVGFTWRKRAKLG